MEINLHYVLPRCDTVSLGEWFPTFPTNMILFLKAKLPWINFLELKPGTLREIPCILISWISRRQTSPKRLYPSTSEAVWLPKRTESLITQLRKFQNSPQAILTQVYVVVWKKFLISRQEEQQSAALPSAPRFVCRQKTHFLRQNGMETIEDARQHTARNGASNGGQENMQMNHSKQQRIWN